jgi:serine/threonine-protein kinase
VPPATLPPHARFQILRHHARGGLGEVFVARDEELKREVALKEIQERHADNPAARARFLLEAEVTGGLEHPGIVPVYGLGSYSDGRPFYAMRFIRGDSLHDAIARFHREQEALPAGERALRLRQLLGRFVAVCQAVAYAHSRGVLHRDLKPHNVMLGTFGETLVVDWGLAKPTGRAGDGTAGAEPPLQPAGGSGEAATVAGQALGTPAFMSPEQAQGRPDLLGPASDVYSLGATLYALLTGRPPIPGDEAAEVVRKAAAGEVVPPRQMNRHVPPALAAVCRKALALRPPDRYATALALAQDVERWLADEPVSAYREPWWARAARWGRRHKAAAAGAITLLVTAVLALAVSTVLISREQGRTEAARQRALANFGKARKAVGEMLTRVSEDKDLLRHLPRMAEVRRRLLEEALAFYQGLSQEDSADPAVRAETARAYLLVGDINRALGRHAQAEGALREAVSRFGHLAAEYPGVPGYRNDLADSHNNLGVLLQTAGRLQEAEASCRAALALRQRLAAEHPAVPDYRSGLAGSHHNLGALLGATGRPREAVESYRAALDLQERLADEHPAVDSYRENLAASRNNLGLLLQAAGRLKEAEVSHRAALALWEHLAAEHPAVPDYRSGLAQSHTNLGNLLKDTGRPQGAEESYRAARAVFERLAAEHPAVLVYRQDLASSHHNLGILLKATGRLKEAEEAHRAALELRQRLVHEHPAVTDYRSGLAASHTSLGALLQATGRPQEAEASYRAALAVFERLAAEHPAVPDHRQRLAQSHHNLGLLLWATGRRQEAEASYRAALDLQMRLAAEHPAVPAYRQDLAGSHTNLGFLLQDTGRPKEAEASFRAALDLHERLANEHPAVPGYRNSLAGTMVNLALILRERRDLGGARRLLEGAREHHRAALRADPNNRTYRLFYRNNRRALADTLVQLGDPAAAAEAAAQLAQAAVDPAGDVYDAACLLARCVPLAEKDAGLPEAKRQELARSYADRALDALRRAVKSGYKDAARMKKDPALDPLRQRPDFQQLLQDLKKMK